MNKLFTALIIFTTAQVSANLSCKSFFSNTNTSSNKGISISYYERQPEFKIKPQPRTKAKSQLNTKQNKQPIGKLNNKPNKIPLNLRNISAKPKSAPKINPLNQEIINNYKVTLKEMAKELNISIADFKTVKVFKAKDLKKKNNHLKYVVLIEQRAFYIDDGTNNFNKFSKRNWGELRNNQHTFLKLEDQYIELTGFGYLMLKGKVSIFEAKDRDLNFIKELANKETSSELFNDIINNHMSQLKDLFKQYPLMTRDLIGASIFNSKLEGSNSEFITLAIERTDQILYFSKQNIPEFGGRDHGVISFENINFLKPNKIKINFDKELLVQFSSSGETFSFSKKESAYHSTMVKDILESLAKTVNKIKTEDMPEERKKDMLRYYKTYMKFYSKFEEKILDLLDQEKITVEDLSTENLAIGVFKKSKDYAFVIESNLNKKSYVFNDEGVFTLTKLNIEKHGSEIFLNKFYGIKIKNSIGFNNELIEKTFYLTETQTDFLMKILDEKLGLKAIEEQSPNSNEEHIEL